MFVLSTYLPFLHTYPARYRYAISYDTPTNFTFVTVQGAGHLVPTYKPHFALTMFETFITGGEFE
jgi:carboxypeptidase C (cathepsin A)